MQMVDCDDQVTPKLTRASFFRVQCACTHGDMAPHTCYHSHFADSCQIVRKGATRSEAAGRYTAHVVQSHSSASLFAALLMSVELVWQRLHKAYVALACEPI